MARATVVFCTTCKGRAPHIKQTLPKNLADNADCESAKFLILNYGSRDDLIGYLREEHAEDIASGRVVLYHYPQADVFRMAHAKNMAHRLGLLEGGEILVNLDADNYAGFGFASYIAEEFARHGNGIFLWSNMIQGAMPRGMSGRIAVSARAFMLAGGYDERFETWSHDDKDFNTRLQRMGFVPREIAMRYLDGVPHNDKMRFREYPQARGAPYADIAIDSSTTTIVNSGAFGSGVVFRNFERQPIVLDSMPTRVFGIGLHKTGTTSLHLALKVLGLDSAHWESAHWAKAIWDQMHASGRSATVERHYALTDLPIGLLYRELDKAYPRSKFILTTRSEESWLASIERHWSPEHNRFRSQWDADPFTHRVHQALYGRRLFDRDVFLERFRRHNAEVREYFRGRPDDLLVMDADETADWPRLCAFLRRPIPPLAYPKARSAEF